MSRCSGSNSSRKVMTTSTSICILTWVDHRLTSRNQRLENQSRFSSHHVNTSSVQPEVFARSLKNCLLMSRRRIHRVGSESESEGSEDFDLGLVENVDDPRPRRGRGRPPGTKKRPAPGGSDRAGKHQQAVPLDDHGEPYKVEDDELVLPIDEAGEKKIDANGKLLGDREYRVRTFTLLGHGDRLYMLSTEPARCMGFRDSYLLFQKHRKLWKIVCSDEEKFDLIDREIIPHSYKGRAIGVVTARSVFREFGSRIVVGGKLVLDDYYESEAIKQGAVAGELADPSDELPPPGVPYNKNQYVAWHGASSVYHQPAGSTPQIAKESAAGTPVSRYEPYMNNNTEPTYLYELCLSASSFNSSLVQKRRQLLLNRTVHEPHTGVVMILESTQPARAHWSHESMAGSNVVVSTVMGSKHRYVCTGLKDVDPSVYECLDADTKAAIAQQVALESQ